MKRRLGELGRKLRERRPLTVRPAGRPVEHRDALGPEVFERFPVALADALREQGEPPLPTPPIDVVGRLPLPHRERPQVGDRPAVTRRSHAACHTDAAASLLVPEDDQHLVRSREEHLRAR